MVKTITYKLKTFKDGSCSVFRGNKKIVSHSGKDARSKCLKASKIDASIQSVIRKRKR